MAKGTQNIYSVLRSWFTAWANSNTKTSRGCSFLGHALPDLTTISIEFLHAPSLAHSDWRASQRTSSALSVEPPPRAVRCVCVEKIGLRVPAEGPKTKSGHAISLTETVFQILTEIQKVRIGLWEWQDP